MNNSKKWSIRLLSLSLATLVLICALTAVIDPFFHYHAPLKHLRYPIDNERYQNDGILKHFSYDAIITGTSMTENFKASECNELFGVNSVKTCFSGSSLKEVNEQLQRAVSANPDIRLIIRGLDGWNLFSDKDDMRTDAEYPTYLYDTSLLNDVEYLLNKQILCENTLEVVKHTIKRYATTNFDQYSYWADYYTFDLESAMASYERPEKASFSEHLTDTDIRNISENLLQNVIQIAQDNPQIEFYYFFTPYSILYMDEQNQYGILESQMEAYLLATQLLLEADNIHLFSFFSDYSTITNLNNYKDPAHYSAEINSLLLQRMAAGEYELTQENYTAHWQEVSQYYLGYNYDALFS